MSSDIAINAVSVQALNTERVDKNAIEQGNDISAKNPKETPFLKEEQVFAPVKESQTTTKANEISEEEIDAAIEVVSNFMSQPPRNVNFTKDDSSGKTVIKVFDKDSQELIKQFPSDEILSIAGKISSLQQEVGKQTGIFLDESI